MRTELIIFICIIITGLYSCKEKTSYGTSIALDNELNDSIYLILYPKETSYSYMENFKMKKSETENIYWKSGQDETPTDIITEVFDSIVVSYKSISILFSEDTVIGYNANLYDDNELWSDKKVEYDTPDNFNRNPHEDIVYTFVLNEDMLGVE